MNTSELEKDIYTGNFKFINTSLLELDLENIKKI